MSPRNILSRLVEAVMRRLGRYFDWAWRYGARLASERRRRLNTPWEGGV